MKNNKKNINIDDYIGKLTKVAPPEFLFNRIQQRIKKEAEDRLSPSWAVGLAFSFVLIIAVNFYAFQSYQEYAQVNSSENETLTYMPNNNLYN